MPESNKRDALIALLQLAYSGELAAAYAYRGHWRSVRNRDERLRIQKIENEEWHHRTLLGEISRRFQRSSCLEFHKVFNTPDSVLRNSVSLHKYYIRLFLGRLG